MATIRSNARRPKMSYDVIPPERALMRTERTRLAHPAVDVEDAEFEIVRPAAKGPPKATFNDNRKSAFVRPTTPPRAHFGLSDAGSAVKASGQMLGKVPRRGLAGLVAVVAVTLALAIHFGPSAFAGRGGEADALAITDLHQSPIDSNGLRVMEVTGSVVNTSGKAMPLPAVVARMTSETGAVNQSAISLGDGLLGAGKSARFMIRIPSPGGKRQEVSIAFAPKGV